MKTIGVDLGGTKLAIALVEKGQILARYEVPTAVEKGPQGVFEQIFQGIDEVMRDDVMGIGIGCPGTVRAEEGIVEFAPNLGWREVEVTGVLQVRCGLKIRLDN
ncbi:MAG: ROK family protein, partial [Limnochordia bacterium]